MATNGGSNRCANLNRTRAFGLVAALTTMVGCSASDGAPSRWEPVSVQKLAQSTDSGTPSLTPGGPSNLYTFNTSAAFGNETIDLTIDVDPGVGAYRFFAFQNQLTTSYDGNALNEYIGLQTDGVVNGVDVGKIARFSVWGAIGSVTSGCSSFIEGSSGWTCYAQYPWQAGHTYALEVSAVSTNGTSWAGYVTDTATHAQTLIGIVDTPAQWLENPGYTFSEYYGLDEPSCADFTLAQVTWANPTANDGTITSVVTSTSPGGGDCFHTSVSAGSAGPVVETAGPFTLNGGGALVAPYLADAYYSGGGTIYHDNTINTTGVTNPAPQAVYQSARAGSFTYTIPSFNPGDSHLVRLHFAETYFSAPGKRVFDVSINGAEVLTNFDIYAAAGAENKAIVEQFTETANSSGQYVIEFTSVVNQSLISGIQIE
jgi:hypothetical protein